MENGWIKIHRQLKDWQHYQEPTVLLVWIDLLLSANSKPAWVRGEAIAAGQVVTSVTTIMESTGIKSKHTVIEALRKLEQSGEITREKFGNGTKITIANFEKFQTSGALGGAKNAPRNGKEGKEAVQQGVQKMHQGGALGGAKNAPKQEYKKEEDRIIVDNPPTRVREEFSEIESTDTSSAQLVMMRQGWNAADYLHAVRELKATCAADGKHHDTPADAANHFRNWTAKRYTYGQRPLTPETPKPETDCDRAFSDWYRQKYGTEYVWQEDTTKAVQRIAAAIADKISEQGDISDPAQMPANIRAFLEAAHRLGDPVHQQVGDHARQAIQRNLQQDKKWNHSNNTTKKRPWQRDRRLRRLPRPHRQRPRWRPIAATQQSPRPCSPRPSSAKPPEP